MNTLFTLNLIEKLKSKVNENNETVDSTKSKQTKVLSSARELNFKLRNFIESDINEKNMFADAQEKTVIIKTRIENCKHNINLIRDKIKNLNIKYQKDNQN